jgi:uncharacterized repeat protein (TIGR01451 family)
MQGGGLLLPNMPINSTLTFTIEATVNAAASAGTITNTASVLVRGETNSASDTNNVITKFNATKTFTPASITAGDTSVMDITLQNTNLGAATNIVFNDIYPSGLVNTGAPGVTNSCGGTIIATAGGNSLALSGGTLAPGASCTITANVTSASTGAYSNSTGTISSDQFVGDPAFATLAVGVSSLQTATKSWQDLNGGEANPGDTIRYTIILTETAGVAATGVSVSDLLPVTLSGATVTSCPTGATCNVAGQTLTATNIAIPANGSVSIVFDASIAPGTTAATAINNCASISNPTGIGASPCASTITVSPSAVAITGNKWLYLDSGTTLSRTKPTGTPSAVTIADGASQTWSLSPILAMPVTISPLLTPLAIIPVNLYLASGTADETRSARVTVACSGGGTTYSQEMTFDGTALNNPYLSTTPNLVLCNNLPFSAEQTCAAGQSWDLTVQNTTTDKNSDILVYPVSGTNTSYFSLPSLSVINVDSVNNYDAVYPAVTTPAGGNFNPGQTVYVRAIVSDPFGSYDISSVAITITDPNGTNRVTLAAMTEVADSLAATKTFEYAYAVPAFPAVGNWNVTVTANEGAEGTVTDDNTSAFAVGTPANLTIVKAADKPSVSPGELVIYTITVNNSGSSSANSVIVTDAMSPFTSLVLDPFGNGTPFNFSDTSGLWN